MLDRLQYSEPCHQMIEQQLTVQDIHLREELQKNTNQTHPHGRVAPITDFSYHSLQLHKQKHLGESNLPSPYYPKMYHSDYKKQQSVDPSKHAEVKIHSLVYSKRSPPFKHKPSDEKKNKLSVSLTMKSKSAKSIEPMLPSWRGQQPRGEQPGGKSLALEQHNIEVQLSKENKAVKQSGVKIQQPSFHNRHPLQHCNRPSGGYLSQLIMQKALQPKKQL